MTPPTPSAPPKAGDDMTRVRDAVRDRCARMGDDGLYDAVNALLTLKRTASELENCGNLYLSKVNLTSGRLNVLMALESADDNMLALSALGDYLVVTRPNITGLVDGLVADGLVRRVDHPEDRRMVLAQLTPEGKRFMGWFVPRHSAYVKQRMSCFDERELRLLVKLLDKFRAHLRLQELQGVVEPLVR